MARRPAPEEDEGPAARRERDDRREGTSGPPAAAEAPLVSDEGVNEGIDELLEETPRDDEEDRGAGRAPSQD